MIKEVTLVSKVQWQLDASHRATLRSRGNLLLKYKRVQPDYQWRSLSCFCHALQDIKDSDDSALNFYRLLR